MEITVQVGVKVSATEKYDMSLSIPGTDPKPDQPFQFSVTQHTLDKVTNEDKLDNVMQIAFSDAKHIYLEVKPPQSVLAAAHVDEYVENLKAIVKEGEYKDGKFVTEGNVKKIDTEVPEEK